MSELSEQYKLITGLIHVDIDKEIASCDPKDLGKLYSKLVWNIQRGIKISHANEQGKKFARTICNLAIKCNIDINSDDVNHDGIINHIDSMIRNDLEFVNKVEENYKNLNTIISYLLLDNDFAHVNEGLITLEDEYGQIILDN